MRSFPALFFLVAVFGSPASAREALRLVDFASSPGKYVGWVLGCTSTLISGRHFVTAAHCSKTWFSESSGIRSTHGFLLNKIFNPTGPDSMTASGTVKSTLASGTFRGTAPHPAPGDSNDDWSIHPIEDWPSGKYGWIEVADFLPEVDEKVSAIGYWPNPLAPKAGNATIDSDCKVTKVENTSITTNCRIGFGASGGPLIVRRHGVDYLIGVNHAILGSESAIHTSSKVFVDWVNRIRRDEGVTTSKTPQQQQPQSRITERPREQARPPQQPQSQSRIPERVQQQPRLGAGTAEVWVLIPEKLLPGTVTINGKEIRVTQFKTTVNVPVSDPKKPSTVDFTFNGETRRLIVKAGDSYWMQLGFPSRK